MSSKLLNYPAASSNPHLAPGSSSGPAASSRSAGHGSAQLNFENLQLDDILCTVCQSVLVEPVFLPCQHRFCRNCLSGTIEKNNLNCPCCRKRFGTWYRNASRVNKLVHEQLWNAIQNQFRDYLEEDNGTRCNGNGSVGSCFVPQNQNIIHISEPGEIRKEYENELQRYRKELIEEKKKELAASEKYIINLYKQEGIIDLVDSSDHLSISSSTSTPEPLQDAEINSQNQNADVHEVEEDEDEAGPSGASFPQPAPVSSSTTTNTGNNQKANQRPPNVISSSSHTNTSRPGSKSASNGSVISISSTSSASAASSSCISFASSRFSLAAQQNAGGADPSKQKVQSSLLSKQPTSSGDKKKFTMADLNSSELCVKPTKLHKRTSNQAPDEEDDGDDSDSLRSELNHFKPILATTPKSYFSPKAIVRVPSVRPETTCPSRTFGLSPSKSPYTPFDPVTPRRSAFSIVNINLFTPPTISLEVHRHPEPSTSGATKKRNPPSSSSTSSSKQKKKQNPQKTKKASLANRRKRKLKFSPPATATEKASVKKTKPKAAAQTASPSKPNRVTRHSTHMEAYRLKDVIVNDQQRRQAMIEQERLDFEFAQKLQRKLNRTRGEFFVSYPDPTSRQILSPRNQNSTYSLRRTLVPAQSQYLQPCNSGTSENPPPPSRKRKSLSTTTPLPSEEHHPKQPKLEATTTTTAAENTTASEASPEGPRRSTRNRH